MANKANKRHIKRLNAPKFFNIHRKSHVYVAKPMPGRHALGRCIPLVLSVQKLELAGNTAEAKRIIRSGSVRINNSTVREPKYPVGLGDIIEVGDAKHCHRITIDANGRVAFEQLKKPDYSEMVYKVIGKYRAPKGQIMLRLHDGSIIKGSNEVKVNDSIVTDDKHSSLKQLEMKPEAKCMVIDGAHVGSHGRIVEIRAGSIKRSASAIIESDGQNFETLVNNIMVVM